MRDGDEDTVRWLSYSQIAALRGISRTSAERIVRRAKWRRQVDNQGVTKAAVPLAYAETERTNPPDSQGGNPPDFARFEVALAAIREAKDGEIAALSGQIDTLRCQLIQADAREDELRERLGAAERARAVAEGLAEAARRETQEAHQATQMAQDTAAELRRADATRKARGRLERVLAAWRGE